MGAKNLIHTGHQTVLVALEVAGRLVEGLVLSEQLLTLGKPPDDLKGCMPPPFHRCGSFFPPSSGSESHNVLLSSAGSGPAAERPRSELW